MKTSRCTCPEPTDSPCAECGCDPQAPWRNAYFTGKMLTARDFRAEQEYFLAQSRRHHVHLHGWGIVCGLEVKPHPICPTERLIVMPGVAIDGAGREIHVPRRRKEYVSYGQTEFLDYGIEVDLPEADAAGGGQAYPDYYLSICYSECPRELTPAPFEDCGCGKMPARIYDGFCIRLSKDKPPSFIEAEALCGHRKSCCDDFLHAPDECANPPEDACVPLTVMRGFIPGEPVTCAHFDDRSRLSLLSTSALTRAIRCLHPPRKTRICGYNWRHGEPYKFPDFIDQFIKGNCGDRRAFAIEFSNPLHPGTLQLDHRHPLLFQATVITHESHSASRPGIAPARISWSGDRHLHLEIDEQYAHSLKGCHAFDVLLQARCNFILDSHGHAVDGNLLARLDDHGDYHVPRHTGDGVAGGLFESWIRVERKP